MAPDASAARRTLRSAHGGRDVGEEPAVAPRRREGSRQQLDLSAQGPCLGGEGAFVDERIPLISVGRRRRSHPHAVERATQVEGPASADRLAG